MTRKKKKKKQIELKRVERDTSKRKVLKNIIIVGILKIFSFNIETLSLGSLKEYYFY